MTISECESLFKELLRGRCGAKLKECDDAALRSLFDLAQARQSVLRGYYHHQVNQLCKMKADEAGQQFTEELTDARRLEDDLQLVFDWLSKAIWGIRGAIVWPCKLLYTTEAVALYFGYLLASGDFINPFPTEKAMWESLAYISDTSHNSLRQKAKSYHHPNIRQTDKYARERINEVRVYFFKLGHSRALELANIDLHIIKKRMY